MHLGPSGENRPREMPGSCRSAPIITRIPRALLRNASCNQGFIRAIRGFRRADSSVYLSAAGMEREGLRRSPVRPFVIRVPRFGQGRAPCSRLVPSRKRGEARREKTAGREGVGKKVSVAMSVHETKHRPRVVVRVGEVTRRSMLLHEI